tara:strand:+ start:1314 stop:2552 length:1239 start_codon:yes stop_codon:yes gene_type:complete
MPLFAYERTEEVPTETEKFLKSKSVDEIFKILDQYKDGIIPQDILAVLYNHKDSSVRYRALASLRNNPGLHKGIVDAYLKLSFKDKESKIRSLALDMYLSLNIWYKNLKSNRSYETETVCKKAAQDPDEAIRAKGAFYTSKLPNQWNREKSVIVLASYAKNPFLKSKARKKVVDELVDHPNFMVRYHLASNPNLKNPVIFKKLSQDDSSPVRAILALNASKNEETEVTLSKDRDALVLYLMSVFCSHENAYLLKDIKLRVHTWIQLKRKELNKKLTQNRFEITISKNDKKQDRLKKAIDRIETILSENQQAINFEPTPDYSDESIFTELTFEDSLWNQLYLTGLEFQHLNDPVIGLSQYTCRHYLHNINDREVLFWGHIDSILFKPFLATSFLGNLEMSFLKPNMEGNYGRE